ncbi:MULTISPECIES: hypothetical protein [Streptomycetaceae]|uniref:hypothetical protein n=1 Tax=Streptomycetaceae TaxID=2062 RepID=UPI000213D23D|nr:MULTISPECIES: hypothetical protein [Streptomycetaceae]MYS57615.1 hypothetical protein [Streptomyces sp. SID5468]CCB73215.1 protein of unknown function [Streptantibioticus cattleyicolor NRRL 8057 = DSM 46488]
MIELSFSAPDPASPRRKTWQRALQVNPAEIPEIDLRYKLFGGAVKFIANGVEIISTRKFVMLADLALSLHDAASRISRREDAAIGFTESEEVILFHSSGETVTIESSRKSEQSTVSRDELLESLSQFVRAVYRQLISDIPGLVDNPVIQQIGPR